MIFQSFHSTDLLVPVISAGNELVASLAVIPRTMDPIHGSPALRHMLAASVARTRAEVLEGEIADLRQDITHAITSLERDKADLRLEKEAASIMYHNVIHLLQLRVAQHTQMRELAEYAQQEAQQALDTAHDIVRVFERQVDQLRYRVEDAEAAQEEAEASLAAERDLVDGLRVSLLATEEALDMAPPNTIPVRNFTSVGAQTGGGGTDGLCGRPPAVPTPTNVEVQAYTHVADAPRPVSAETSLSCVPRVRKAADLDADGDDDADRDTPTAKRARITLA
ncbi:hypothetical protein DFH07DRAFT_832999 [Mycena maculata]|uniref:Uncharacterized protein n=1 Tax=Mycena maculata TaxID=230809 RepID=A0AAD7N614_9AGAR|nr:hypothetical protein DFH07DRAFT_832999 [Mycena maculata]